MLDSQNLVKTSHIDLIFFWAGRGEWGLQEYEFFTVQFTVVRLWNVKYGDDKLNSQIFEFRSDFFWAGRYERVLQEYIFF